MLCIKCKINHAAGKQKWCSSCKKEYDRLYYQKPENKNRHRKRTRENQKKFKAWYDSLKEGKPCVDCKISYPVVAMDWDHLPQFIKIDDLASLVKKGNKKVILEEIAKCELRCKNCHAIKTHLPLPVDSGPETSNLSVEGSIPSRGAYVKLTKDLISNKEL